MAVYLTSSIFSHMNIGLRHVLPVYAPAMILCGAAGVFLSRAFKAVCVAVVALVAVLAAEAAWAWPNYLAYFNPIGGGERGGYRHLVDSSLDWGQDLPALKAWLAQPKNVSGKTPVFLSYFGTASPTWYGIRATQRLPGPNLDVRVPEIPRYRAGVYCVSATMLEGVFRPALGPWTPRMEERYRSYRDELQQMAQSHHLDPELYMQLAAAGSGTLGSHMAEYDDLRFGRLLAYLRNRTPDDNICGSILIYRLSEEDIRQAFDDPPAQLRPDVENPFLK